MRARRSLAASVLAFVALPGVVAYGVPAALASLAGTGTLAWLGGAPFAGGTGLLLWCAREFHRRGHGTLAPWSPPRELVAGGVYRCSRNPMYLAVLLVLLGWAWALRSGVHAAYAAVVALGFHLRVVLGEEPLLARSFGARWSAYQAAVPRWLPPAGRWPWTLWLLAGCLLGASLWLLSPALLGTREPWDSPWPLWSTSWPMVGILGARAGHPRGLCLALGHALGQCAAIGPTLLSGEFGALGALFIAAGLATAAAVTVAMLLLAAAWRRWR